MEVVWRLEDHAVRWRATWRLEDHDTSVARKTTTIDSGSDGGNAAPRRPWRSLGGRPRPTTNGTDATDRRPCSAPRLRPLAAHGWLGDASKIVPESVRGAPEDRHECVWQCGAPRPRQCRMRLRDAPKITTAERRLRHMRVDPQTYGSAAPRDRRTRRSARKDRGQHLLAHTAARRPQDCGPRDRDNGASPPMAAQRRKTATTWPGRRRLRGAPKTATAPSPKLRMVTRRREIAAERLIGASVALRDHDAVGAAWRREDHE